VIDRAAFGRRGPHDRAIFALAIPALGSLIADPLLSLVDTAFVARLGTEALGALGVSTAVFAVAFWAFNFLEYGTTAAVAQAVGATDPERARRAGATALSTALFCGVVALVVLEAFTGPILGVLGASAEVRGEAVTYLRIRALAVPAVLLIRAGHGIFRGYQNTRTPFVVTAGLNLVNLVLDPLLIFAAGLGVAGAAWATVTAQWAGAACFLVLFLRPGDASLRGVRPAADEVRAFLVVGRDLVIRTGSLLAVMTAATAVAARVSDAAIAAHQVLYQLWTFLALAVDALAVAGQAMVGRHVGAGDREAAGAVADRLVVLGAVVGVVLGAGVAAVAGFLPEWFGDDPQVGQAIESAAWLLVATQPIGAVVFVWDGVFMGAGDFRYLAGAMVVAAGIGAALLALVLPLGWGLPGVWWAISALLGARLVTLAWRRVDPAGPFGRRPDRRRGSREAERA
jgi:putative MATE family efflux protein